MIIIKFILITDNESDKFHLNVLSLRLNWVYLEK